MTDNRFPARRLLVLVHCSQLLWGVGISNSGSMSNDLAPQGVGLRRQGRLLPPTTVASAFLEHYQLFLRPCWWCVCSPAASQSVPWLLAWVSLSPALREARARPRLSAFGVAACMACHCCATSCGGGARGQSLQPNQRAAPARLVLGRDACDGCIPSHCTLHLLDSDRHSGHDKIARPGSVSSGTPFKSNPIARDVAVDQRDGRPREWQ